MAHWMKIIVLDHKYKNYYFFQNKENTDTKICQILHKNTVGQYIYESMRNPL